MNEPHTHFFEVKSKTPPTLEFDPSIMGIYVRFRKEKVAKTIPSLESTGIVNLDLNAKGEVIGIEAIGIEGLSLSGILEMAHVQAPKVDLSRATFSPMGNLVAQSV